MKRIYVLVLAMVLLATLAFQCGGLGSCEEEAGCPVTVVATVSN